MGLLTLAGLRRPNQWERRTLLDWLLTSPLQLLATRFYHIVLSLRGRPFRPPIYKRPIVVVCMSDTHEHRLPAYAIPQGDLLIHAGDLTSCGTAAAVQEQIDWLASLPHRHKVIIAGNHDSWFDPEARRPEDCASELGASPGQMRQLDMKGLHYLENSGVTLEFEGARELNVWGSPALPQCGGPENAFQYVREKNSWEGRIPDDTDVLVTHTPPRHHRDLDLGCAGLLEEVWRVKPKLHVFGHVHWGYGRESVYYDECQRTYESLMARPPRGPLGDLLLPRYGYLADATALVRHGVHSVLWKWIMSGPGSNNGGMMLNASVMYGNSGRLLNKVQVVEL